MARPFFFGSPRNDSVEAKLQWVMDSLQEIERRSQSDPIDVFDSYAITGTLVKTRTIDVTTPTAANAAAVIATLIDDMQRRGVFRLEPT